MLYASEVYETVLDLIRKDLRGRSLSPDEYNNVARVVNELVFEKYYSEFEDTLENSESMSGFKIINEAVAIGAGGIGNLPARYYHICGKPRYTDIGGVIQRLDLVSSFEHAEREGDYLTKATLTHPTFMFGTASAVSDMDIYVTPTVGISTIYIDYIRTPNIPFLDYYVNDTTYAYTWMANGATVAVPSGSTARDGTTGAANVTSLTVNWEFDDEDLPLICALFLQKLGVQLPDEVAYQGGMLEEQKIS